MPSWTLLLKGRLSAYQMRFKRQLPGGVIRKQAFTSSDFLNLDRRVAHCGHSGYHSALKEAERQSEAKVSSETQRSYAFLKQDFFGASTITILVMKKLI